MIYQKRKIHQSTEKKIESQIYKNHWIGYKKNYNQCNLNQPFYFKVNQNCKTDKLSKRIKSLELNICNLYCAGWKHHHPL